MEILILLDEKLQIVIINKNTLLKLVDGENDKLDTLFNKCKTLTDEFEDLEKEIKTAIENGEELDIDSQLNNIKK